MKSAIAYRIFFLNLLSTNPPCGAKLAKLSSARIIMNTYDWIIEQLSTNKIINRQ